MTHSYRITKLPGAPPAYRGHCTQCDSYTSQYWNKADVPTSHDDEPYDGTERQEEEIVNDQIAELIEAARPFAEAEPQPNWPCHGGDPQTWLLCGNCSRIKRLRAAIDGAELALHWTQSH
jgi:hypothetical protein